MFSFHYLNRPAWSIITVSMYKYTNDSYDIFFLPPEQTFQEHHQWLDLYPSKASVYKFKGTVEEKGLLISETHTSTKHFQCLFCYSQQCVIYTTFSFNHLDRPARSIRFIYIIKQVLPLHSVLLVLQCLYNILFPPSEQASPEHLDDSIYTSKQV